MVARKRIVFRFPWAKPPYGCLNQIRPLKILFISGIRIDLKHFLQLSQEEEEEEAEKRYLGLSSLSEADSVLTLQPHLQGTWEVMAGEAVSFYG